MPHAPHIHRWYCTASWQRRRAHQLMIEPLCRLCLEAGRVTSATVADHVTPHREDYNAFRLGQLRSLCADCHNRLDRTNSPRAPVREDGTPTDPSHPTWAHRTGALPKVSIKRIASPVTFRPTAFAFSAAIPFAFARGLGNWTRRFTSMSDTWSMCAGPVGLRSIGCPVCFV